MSIDLVKTCLALLDKYDTNFSPEAYLENLEDFEFYQEYEKKFILESFYGCFDRKKILDIVVDGYYSKDGKNCLRSDRSLYTFISYLILYQIKYHGLKELNVLSRYQNQEKIFKFLKFILNDKNLLTWMKDAWSSLYDETYVEDNLLNPLLEKLPELNLFLNNLEQSIYAPKQRPKPFVTQPVPFNITEPTPRKIPLPEPMPERQVFKPIKALSQSVNSIPNLIKQEAKNTKSIKKELNNLQNSNKKVPPLPPRQISKSATDNNMQKLKKIEPIKQFKAKPFINKQNDQEPVKLNTATVLKDEHLIKKQVQDVLKKFDYLETGQGNPNEFLKWQTEMKLNDLKQEQERIEMKKLQAKLTHEEAIIAKANLVESKKTQVKQIQQENSKIRSEFEEKSKLENERIKNIVNNIIEDEKKVKQIKEKVKENNKAIVQQVIKESEQMEIEAFKEMEEEMRKKIELIQQIKAAESIPINRTKPIDITSTAGHGLLSEMSIAELTERLEIAKQENEEYYRKKHDEIIKAKVEKEENLVEKLNFINKYKNESVKNEKSATNTFENMKKKLIDDAKNSESVARLKKKLEETKEAREKVVGLNVNKQEAKLQLNTYANQRKMLEMNRFKDLEQTHERYRFLNLESAKITNFA